MNDPFDLTSRPWIPCERLDGTSVELSTRDTLAEAHQLRGLVDPSPLVIAVLHRHLLAVLHRAVSGPRTLKEWSAIARAGRFEVPLVETYLTSVRDRMDLFHPTQPFAQTRGLVQQFESNPIDEITMERSSWGAARSLFQHRPAGYRASMTPARATRELLVHHAFATGGLVKKPGEPTSATASPLVRAAVVLLRGESLFHTLAANLLRYDPSGALPIPGVAEDRPSWEQPPPPSQLRVDSEPKRLPMGWLDLLTWLSRRIELVREDDRVIAYVRAVGQGLAEGAPQDPMVTYKIDEKRGFLSVGINPNRAFWRDASAFFEAGRDEKRFLRPKTIDQAATPEATAILGTTGVYSLEVHGLAADQSKLEVLRSERVCAAVRHFDDPDARNIVEKALEGSEQRVSALWAALRSYARHLLSQGDRMPETKDISALTRSLGSEEALWSALGVAFDVLLRGLDDDQDRALASFLAEATRLTRGAFASAIASAQGTARSLKARAIAERSLNLALQALDPQPTATPQEASHG